MMNLRTLLACLRACVMLLTFGSATPVFAMSTDSLHKATHRKMSIHAKHRTTKAVSTKKQRIHQTIQSHVKLHTPPPGHEGEEHNDWFFRRRAWPNATIDPDAYPNALAEARRMPVYGSTGKDNALSTMTWQCIGPYSIDGRATCIATHPTDSNTFY